MSGFDGDLAWHDYLLFVPIAPFLAMTTKRSPQVFRLRLMGARYPVYNLGPSLVRIGMAVGAIEGSRVVGWRNVFSFHDDEQPPLVSARVVSSFFPILSSVFRWLPRTQKPPAHFWVGGFVLTRRLSTLPHPLKCSTIDVGGLNFCVRHGNRCDPAAIATENILS